MRIVIVSADPARRAEWRRLLTVDGGRCATFVEADGAQSALAGPLAGSGPWPDCVLLDHELPDARAAQVLTALTRADALPACPVVVLTDDVSPATTRAMLRAGAHELIGNEGLSAPALQRAVHNAIERQALAHDARTQDQALHPAAADPDAFGRALNEAMRSLADPEAVKAAATGVFGLAHAEAQAQLRASEERLRVALAAGGMGVWTWVPASYEAEWDEGIEALIGVRCRGPGTGCARDFMALLHPDDAPALWADALHVMRHGGHYHHEFRLLHPDGRTLWLAAHATAVRDAHGHVLHITGVNFDITQRKQAEQALRSSQRELQTLADNTPDVLARFDCDLRAVFVNAAVARTVGRDKQECLGKSTRELGMPSELCDRWETAIRSVFATGQRVSMEFDYAAADGLRRYAARFVPEFGPGGDVEHALGVAHDVTEQKLAEQALREADRHKDEFLATLAHELRNLLAPIRNGMRLLRHTPQHTETIVAMMERQLGHLVHLVDDLLDVSRISRGLITLRLERIAVGEVIDAAVESCRPTIDAKRHHLEVALAHEPLAVVADRTRLVQIVSNLLTNAAKYTDPGGLIGVAAARDDAGAVIRVSDNGTGIAPDDVPTLWNMFTQVRDTLDRAQGGLGIGLALVRKLAEMHGGSVRAASLGPGRGSTFEVLLPLAPDQVDAGATHAAPAIATAASAPVARRVLVVDDSTDGADSLAALLRVSGHTVTVAYAGPQALDAALAQPPEIVFLDIDLPGMDGYEVARRLRADARTASALLVALTGWGSDDDKRKAIDAGFDVHLTKPVEMAAIDKVFDRLAGR